RTELDNCLDCNYPRLPGHDCLHNSGNSNTLKRFTKNQETKETISPEINLEEKFRKQEEPEKQPPLSPRIKEEWQLTLINLDNVKKYYDEILLCKTCYHTQFEELEIDDPKAAEYYKKEGINKLTEYNFCCKPIRKRQGYQLWNTGQYMCCLKEMIAFMVYAEITDRSTYQMITLSYDELDDQFNDSDEPITDQDIIIEPEEINTEEQDQIIADIATQNLDYDYKPKELDTKNWKEKTA
ncbi:17391_t:CDS:2, partial [Racocetra persica]